VLVVCRHRRWLAMAARDGDQMVLDAVGETDDGARQVELMVDTLLAGFGEAAPADIEGVNLRSDLIQGTLERAAPLGRDAIEAAVRRLGLGPRQAEVLTAATRLDESAMAVVMVIDHDLEARVHQRKIRASRGSRHGRYGTRFAAAHLQGRRLPFRQTLRREVCGGEPGSVPRLGARPRARAAIALAHAQALRRHLEQLVVLDVLEALLEREVARRREGDVVVPPGRAHVRQLLRAADVELLARPIPSTIWIWRSRREPTAT